MATKKNTSKKAAAKKKRTPASGKPKTTKAAAAKKKPAAKKVKPRAAKKSPAKKKKSKPETLMCFLTTACVHYYHLPDDGYELNTLRKYRDTYLASSEEGKELIKEYYRVSPEIVKQVEKDPEKGSVYTYIYSEVKTACANIDSHQLLTARRVYTQMVQTLMSRYQVN
jgi:translation initiation factor 2 beta subunit (eIF-2beta)/eIF-5